MSASETVEAGREAAEELMVDAGELRGPDVKGPLNQSTGQYPITPGALKYSGKAKLQTTDTIGNKGDAAERVVMTTRFELHLPMSAPAAAVDDVWTMTSSELDPELVGRRFRVASLVHKSFMTARRLAVEEVQS
jgi:hypothetical protein